jgi:hypothetical protein
MNRRHRLPRSACSLPADTADFRPHRFQALLLSLLMRRLLLAVVVPALVILSGVLLNLGDLDALLNGWNLPWTGAPAPPGIGFGVIAAGGLSVGIVAVGGLSVGVIAVGGCSVGIIAIGGGALGLFAFGGGAVGLFGAVGGGAIGWIAMGGGAVGEWVLAGDGIGPHQLTLERQDEVAIDYWCGVYPGLREAFPNRWPELPANRGFLDELRSRGGAGGGGAAA